MAAVGRLALAVVGYAVGGPLGGMVGSVLGGLLFPQEVPDQHGPKLSDTSITNSSYGVGIPKVWGTYKVSGNVIWAGPVTEHKESTEIGKGGGPEYHEYTYTQSFALALCEGPIKRVTKILFDNKLVYDATGDTVNAGVHFRFYKGDEDQLPDSLIEQHQGAGNVPAFRGLAYLVFDELDITSYGRIPTIEVHVQDAGEDASIIKPVVDTYYYFRNNMIVDMHRGVAYADMTDSVRIYDVDTRQLRAEINKSSVGIRGSIVAAGNGLVVEYWYNLHATGRFYLVLRDGSTMMPVPRTEQIYIGNMHKGMFPDNIEFFYWLDPETGIDHMICSFSGGALGNNSWTSFYNFVDPDRSWDVNDISNGPVITCYAGGGQLYIAYGAKYEDHTLCIQRISWNHKRAHDQYPVKIDVRQIDPLLSPLVRHEGGNAGTDTLINEIYVDPTDHNVIVTLGRTYMIKVDVESGDILWSFKGRKNPSYGMGRIGKGSDLSAGRVLLLGDKQYVLDTRTGAVVYETASDVTNAVYNSKTNSSFITDALLGSQRKNQAEYYQRAPDVLIPIELVLETLRVDSKAKPFDYADVKDCQIRGYMRASPTTGRSMIDPIATMFSIDFVDESDKIRLKRRGSAAVKTVEKPEMVVVDNDTGAVLQTTRTQEIELPYVVSVTYADYGRDLEQSTYHAARYAGNVEYSATDSRNRVTLEAAMAIDGNIVKQRADTMLREYWNGRDLHALKLPRPMLDLETGDVITLSIPGRVPQDVRIEEISIGADISIEVKAISQDSSQYTSIVPAEAGSGFIKQTIPSPNELLERLYLLPVPLLLDSNDTGRDRSMLYYAVGAYHERWRIGVLEYSRDGIYEKVGDIGGATTHGAIVSEIPVASADKCFGTDEDLKIQVRLIFGALNSITQEQMLNGANAAVVIHSDSRAEVLQFRDAELGEDGIYTLSGILRGRRGTDHWARNYVAPAGASFVLLNTKTAGGVFVPLADLGKTRVYRASEAKQDRSTGDVRSIVAAGYDLMPYAPVHVQAEGDQDTDWVFAWTRRTRLGGELASGTGTVPLQEDVEKYEVDIYLNGVLARTLESDVSHVVYTVAMQVEDGYQHTDIGEIVVYQISVQVGRGFASDRLKFNGIALDISKLDVVSLMPTDPQQEVAQLSVVAMHSLQPALDFSQLGVIVLHEEQPKPNMDISQLGGVVLNGAASTAMDISQLSSVVLHETEFL